MEDTKMNLVRLNVRILSAIQIKLGQDGKTTTTIIASYRNQKVILKSADPGLQLYAFDTMRENTFWKVTGELLMQDDFSSDSESEDDTFSAMDIDEEQGDPSSSSDSVLDDRTPIVEMTAIQPTGRFKLKEYRMSHSLAYGSKKVSISIKKTAKCKRILELLLLRKIKARYATRTRLRDGYQGASTVEHLPEYVNEMIKERICILETPFLNGQIPQDALENGYRQWVMNDC
ncbi:hypothetical protein [Absidia glauca]|uniref:Uncharacterized protein n=1 Tax=Absidia glauca TaxID=4829 RepID=A0A168PPZ8_ABSGL|nr:hypothetical protein [Absidia glauca]